MKNRPTPKFRRRSEERPDEILDAALKLFLVHGFSQTKIEQIAEEARLSKGTVYLYFSSKEALFEALVRRAVGPVAERATSELGAGADHPRQAIHRVLTGLAQAMSDPKAVAVPLLVVREAVAVPSVARMYRKEVLDKVVPALSSLIARAIASGQFRSVDPDLTVRSIVGGFLAHVLMAKIFGIVPEGGLQLDRLVENHLDILFDGLDAKPKPK